RGYETKSFLIAQSLNQIEKAYDGLPRLRVLAGRVDGMKTPAASRHTNTSSNVGLNRAGSELIEINTPPD
ncbi:MAG: hypothetical protein AAGE03_01160, partial [Pseudomonadota bacterium]